MTVAGARWLAATNATAPLTPEQIDIVNGLADAASALSVVGSVFILVCYVWLSHMRSFAFTLVAMLSLTDVLNQIFDFVQPSPSELEEMTRTGSVSATCYTQALGDSMFELASVLWTTAIAAMLHMSVFQRMTADDVSKRWKWFVLWCYGVPLVLTLLPLADRAYGPAGSWCWITEAKAYWRFIQFYGPLWIAIIFNTVVYVRVLRLLRRVSAGGPNDVMAQRIRALVTRLQMYPFILVVVWLFASINRVYEAASGGRQVFALFLLQRVMSSLQGFLNAFAYGFSGGIREALAEKMAPVCPCLARATPEDELVRSKRVSNSLSATGVVGTGPLADGDADDGDDDDIHVAVPPTPHNASSAAIVTNNMLPRALTHAQPASVSVATSVPSRGIAVPSSLPNPSAMPAGLAPSDSRGDRVAIMKH